MWDGGKGGRVKQGWVGVGRSGGGRMMRVREGVLLYPRGLFRPLSRQDRLKVSLLVRTIQSASSSSSRERASEKQGGTHVLHRLLRRQSLLMVESEELVEEVDRVV